MPAAEQRAWVAALLQPLVGQMEGQLAAAAAGGTPRFGGAGPPSPALLVQQALEAVTRVAKGLSLKLCTEARPELGGLLAGALQAAVAAPRALPANKPLRARFISFLHRMVECLGARWAAGCALGGARAAPAQLWVLGHRLVAAWAPWLVVPPELRACASLRPHAKATPQPHTPPHPLSSSPRRSLLPYLPAALEVLLYAEADATDVVDVLLLLNQLAARFKDALAPVMQVCGKRGRRRRAGRRRGCCRMLCIAGLCCGGAGGRCPMCLPLRGGLRE